MKPEVWAGLFATLPPELLSWLGSRTSLLGEVGRWPRPRLVWSKEAKARRDE